MADLLHSKRPFSNVREFTNKVCCDLPLPDVSPADGALGGGPGSSRRGRRPSPRRAPGADLFRGAAFRRRWLKESRRPLPLRHLPRLRRDGQVQEPHGAQPGTEEPPQRCAGRGRARPRGERVSAVSRCFPLILSPAAGRRDPLFWRTPPRASRGVPPSRVAAPGPAAPRFRVGCVPGKPLGKKTGPAAAVGGETGVPNHPLRHLL